MKASLYNFKQSPRKVRLVADMIRGKKALVARDMLAFTPKKSSPEIEKLLVSAIANARQAGMNPEDLVVKAISVDKGAVLRRFKPMARGRAAAVRRTMSIVKIELGAASSFVKKMKPEAKAETIEKKPAAKPARPGKPRAQKSKK